MRNPLFIFAVMLIIALSSTKSEATVVKSMEHLPKYDCKTTSKPVLKKAIKKRIAQIKEERIVLIKPTCPIVDDEIERKKRIGYGAERDLTRDTIWNSTTRSPDVYTFNSGFVNTAFVGGSRASYYVVTNDVRYVPPLNPSAVPIPSSLILLSSSLLFILRRKFYAYLKPSKVKTLYTF